MLKMLSKLSKGAILASPYLSLTSEAIVRMIRKLMLSPLDYYPKGQFPWTLILGQCGPMRTLMSECDFKRRRIRLLISAWIFYRVISNYSVTIQLLHPYSSTKVVKRLRPESGFRSRGLGRHQRSGPYRSKWILLANSLYVETFGRGLAYNGLPSQLNILRMKATGGETHYFSLWCVQFDSIVLCKLFNKLLLTL